MAQTASRDDFVNTTVFEGLADCLTPLNKLLSKVGIVDTKLGHVVRNNLFLNSGIRVRLLKRDSEPLKECLIDDGSRNEATSVIALTLGVCSSNHVEPWRRNDYFTSLLDHEGLALKNALQTHQLVRATVNLIYKQDRSSFHGFDHRTFCKDSLAIKQSEATDQIILVSLRSNLNTNVLTFCLGAGLLNHHSLTVARQASYIHGVEHTRLDDF